MDKIKELETKLAFEKEACIKAHSVIAKINYENLDLKARVEVLEKELATADEAGAYWRGRTHRLQAELQTMVKDHKDCGCMTCRFAQNLLKEL